MTAPKLFLALFFLPFVAFAQKEGTISGIVTDDATRTAVAGATIRIENVNDASRRAIASTNSQGRFTVTKIPEGNYRIECTALGHKKLLKENIHVNRGEVTMIEFGIATDPLNAEAVVVSASRVKEKILDAPASITTVSPREIAEHPGFTPMEHLRGVAGVDIAKKGLLQQDVVTRGFNNVFSGTVLMLSDNRQAGVPSLRVNIPYFVQQTDEDIDHIEVVRGPASALYGPNATNGVINIISKSPFVSKGTTISVTGGERSVVQPSVRHAGTVGETFGYKISGQYFRGNDWLFTDTAEVSARRDARRIHGTFGSNRDSLVFEDTLRIGKRDPILERFTAEARIDWIPADDLTFNLTGGISEAMRAIEMTNIGAAQARDWQYTFLQARANYGSIFAQAFINKSDAGSTYLLRTGAPIVDRSTQVVAQLQDRFSFSDNDNLTAGFDYIGTHPVTDSTINGRNEEHDDITEVGAYAQYERPVVVDVLNFILAARADHHSELTDIVFSPRAAVVYKPSSEQTLRLTYNRSYATPTTTDLFLDITAQRNVFPFPDALRSFNTDVRAMGVNGNGFHFARNDGLAMHSKFTGDARRAVPVADAASSIWPLLQLLVAAQFSDTTIGHVPAPTRDQVHSYLALLNKSTARFDSVGDAYDVPKLAPTIIQTTEAGYTGLLGGNLLATLDVYRSDIHNFIGPPANFTPNVKINGSDLYIYLYNEYLNHGSDTATARARADTIVKIIAQLPVGTVTPEGVPDPTAIYFSPHNYGKITLYGVDLSLRFEATPEFIFSGTYSFVSKNYFTASEISSPFDLALNAPKHKASIALQYRNSEYGIMGELRDRWTDWFPMNSGVYVGSVDAAHEVDATLGWQSTSFSLAVSATNLLNHSHQFFVGAPFIGRLVIARASYSL